MKNTAIFLAIALTSACGSKSNFKGEGQQGTTAYSGNIEPVVQEPETKPPVVTVPDECPNANGPVKAGPFEVSTEPACPRQFEIYTVVIKVVLPANLIADYDASTDLTGNIVGTDGFGKGFGPGSGTPTTFDKTADGGTFRVSLYAGSSLVDDTVQITSSALKTFQTVVLYY